MLPNSDETKGAPSDQTQGQANGNQKQDVPEYVTKAILDDRLGQIDESLKQFRAGLQETLSKNYQGVQRQTDRYQQSVQKQIGSFEQQLRDLQQKGYVKMSEQEIQQAVRDNQIDQLLTQQNQQPGQQAQPVSQDNDFNSQVTAAAARIEQKYGVTLEEGDPEISQFEIDKYAQSPNPEDFLLAIQQAAQAKSARIKQQGPARAPGLLPSAPDTSNPLNGVTDLDAIWSQTSLGKLRG